MTKYPICYPYWVQCISRKDKNICDSERVCDIERKCREEWIKQGGIMATEKEIKLWDS